jgi:hypothetical protein
LLKTSLQTFRKLYVVIDGIDECEREERRQIVSFFEKAWESLPQNDNDSLRCMFISQDDNVARKDFANMSSLRVTESDTQSDIVAYVKARSVGIKSHLDLTTDRQQWTQDQIVKSADGKLHSPIFSGLLTAPGMFLFAHLMTSYLFDLTSLAELEYELSPERFPQGATRLEDV